jgi:guanylate kinase
VGGCSQPARLTVLAGPSGVGKGSVAALVAARHPSVRLSVSATTRPPRPGEVEGRTYFFVTREDFGLAVSRGELLEWAEYGGNLYGTPKGPVEAALAAGRPVLLEIDLAGARQVRAAMPEALLVFLLPPSWAELERRLTERGTEDATARAARLATARAEVAAQGEFDAVIVNDRLERAADQLAELMGLATA